MPFYVLPLTVIQMSPRLRKDSRSLIGSLAQQRGFQ